MNADIINLFDRFHLSQTLRHLKMEKQQGISASLLIVLLCLFRMCHESIGSFASHPYTLLALDKRFSGYETMGEFFGQHREDLMALTLWRRILEMIIAILEALSEVMSINLEELTENILNNETAAKKCAVMLNALQEYNRVA